MLVPFFSLCCILYIFLCIVCAKYIKYLLEKTANFNKRFWNSHIVFCQIFNGVVYIFYLIVKWTFSERLKLKYTVYIYYCATVLLYLILYKVSNTVYSHSLSELPTIAISVNTVVKLTDKNYDDHKDKFCDSLLSLQALPAKKHKAITHF